MKITNVILSALITRGLSSRVLNICIDNKSLLFCITCVVILCGCASTDHMQTDIGGCGDYIDFHKSMYILPFLPGQKHEVIQGNCSKPVHPWTHFGIMKYAYDFAMPIGTKIIAARSGTVLFVRDEFTDNDHGKNQGNAIVLLQEDGTYALYAHITHKGSKVKVGQYIKRGELLALSGNSGESPIPHLHFQVNSCGDFSKCESLPVTFRNVLPSTNILEQNLYYQAK